MKEPRRLLADAETSELSRSLLAAGRGRREREGARERVWSAVAMGVAGGAAGGAPSLRAVAPALAKAKLVVVGIVVLAAAGAGVILMAREAPVATSGVVTTSPTASIEVRPSSMDRALRAASPEEIPSPADPRLVAPIVGNEANKRSVPARRSVPPPAALETTPVEPPSPKSPAVDAEPAPPAPISKLREEAVLLQQARADLAQGDIVSARAKLADARSRFPNSELGEERDALDVRVTNASGDHARAASLARAFVAHYPDSPLRAGVESIGRAPEKQ